MALALVAHAKVEWFAWAEPVMLLCPEDWWESVPDVMASVWEECRKRDYRFLASEQEVQMFPSEDLLANELNFPLDWAKRL
jgi:hypothetical protein